VEQSARVALLMVERGSYDAGRQVRTTPRASGDDESAAALRRLGGDVEGASASPGGTDRL